MIKFKSFQEMPVWQKAMELSMEVFDMTVDLPRSEDYGLTSQLRKSSNSVPGNVAEAFGRKSKRDMSNLYIVARGSAYETQSHLIYGNRVGYFENEKVKELLNDYNELIHDINRILKSFNE